VSPRWVCVFFVGYRVTEANRRKKKIPVKGEKKRAVLIPRRVSDFLYITILLKKRSFMYIHIYSEDKKQWA
jgi:hypothetical protein